MYNWKTLTIVVVLFIISYAAAVGVYLILPDVANEASFTHSAIKLSGPIAAFVSVFLIQAYVFNRFSRESSKIPNPLDPAAADLEGTWDIVSESYGKSGETRVSQAEFCVRNQMLEMFGSGLQKVVGNESKDTGLWKCEAVFFRSGRLIYIYEMEDLAFAQERSTRGVVVAQVVRGITSGKKLSGTWSTYGGEPHGGTITLTKRG